MTIPRAEIAPPAGVRLSRWLVARFAPPRRLAQGGGAVGYWCISGALAAGFLVGLIGLGASGKLWEVDMTLSLLWAVMMVFGIIPLFLPFLLCYFIYHVVVARSPRLRGRWVGAAYGAAYHLGGHFVLLSGFGLVTLNLMTIAPLLVGGLWGSWLPATLREE